MTVGGEDNPFVTALINIDFDNVGRWAERRGLAYTTFVDLSQKPEVYELIREDVERVNRTLPPAARVRKFVLLHKEFDADEGELTRTRKLRRGLAGRTLRRHDRGDVWRRTTACRCRQRSSTATGARASSRPRCASQRWKTKRTDRTTEETTA